MAYSKEGFNPEYQRVLKEFTQETDRSQRVQQVLNRHSNAWRDRVRQRGEELKQQLVEMQSQKFY